MKGKLKQCVMMAMLFSLFMPDMAEADGPTATPTSVVMLVPAYTLITDALNGMVPKVDGKVNEDMMRLVCDIARGDRSRVDTLNALEHSKINIHSVPEQGSLLSILVHGDLRQQQTLCASYLATLLFSPPDNAQYREVKKVQVTEEKRLPPPPLWKVWAEQKSERVTREQENIGWNTAKFSQDVKVQVAVAKATAQLYALLAGNLGDQVQTQVMVDSRVKQTLGDLAEGYLALIQQIYSDYKSQTVAVNALNENGYVVSDSSGNILWRGTGGLRLTYQGIEWFGNGKILGKEYFVNLSLQALPVTATESTGNVGDKPPLAGKGLP